MDSDIRITWLGVSAIITGIGIYLMIDEYVEPWVIETMCRELISCD